MSIDRKCLFFFFFFNDTATTEIYTVMNTLSLHDALPISSGTRVVRALFDDLRVEWTEQLDHTAVQGQGMIGFDERSGRFYSTSLSNAGSGAEFMTGVPDPNEPRITFSPMSLLLDAGGGQQSAALSMLDQN